MWSNLQEAVDLVTFTEEIHNGKLHFLCSVSRPAVAVAGLLSSASSTGFSKTHFAETISSSFPKNYWWIQHSIYAFLVLHI